MEIEITPKRPLSLFEGYGVELEYMIVNAATLNVLPVADKLLEAEAGTIINEVHRGNGCSWSNELALHVIEMKTSGAAVNPASCGAVFQSEVAVMETHLEKLGARLMPGPMHPWMNPFTEIKLWPHEYNPIYEAYNRIFDCRGHGWANVQSTHLNLPFNGDAEFEKLHAALRVILPLIPAMAAASPIADSQRKSWLNYRMETYRTNSLRIPSVTGKIIPEPLFSKQEYQEKIFDVMYRDISPFDPDGILQDEWLNSRGAISRWDRNTIEVRVTDIQEFPAADIAIAEWISELTRYLIQEPYSSIQELKQWDEHRLSDLFLQSIKEGENAEPDNPAFAALFGFNKTRFSMGELCAHTVRMLNHEGAISSKSSEHLDLIIREGTLATRLLRSLPEHLSRVSLENTWERLCNHLRSGTPFTV